MVVYPASALTTVVKIIAAFMIASGVVSLVVGLRDKERGALPLMSFNALINLLLAILMFVFAPVIAKFVIYLIGFVLLACLKTHISAEDYITAFVRKYNYWACLKEFGSFP